MKPHGSAPPVHRERRLRRFRLRTILQVLAACVVLAALLLGGAALGLRHAMHAALPQVDGSLQVTGLSAPVTVTRDEHGVPSLTAATIDDVLFAQGFITAQDRLFQMDGLRRHAAGELAEILGSRFVKHDRVQRTLQVRAAADRALATLPPDQSHQLEAYARGVNAFLAQNADHLPVEFKLLRYKPAPWTPRDSLLVGLAMAQDLSTEYPTKLLRESLSAHLPPELAADLYPVGSWRDHPPAEAQPDLTSPRPEIEQIPLDESQSKLELPGASPRDLLQARADASLTTCEDCRAGSNNWALAGSRTASGLPLVSNDMHLGLAVPGIWYEAALHVNGALDVAGITLPGLPFVIVGCNAHVAWGFTNLSADLQDVYIEHTRGEGQSMEYQRADGTWQRVGHHAEQIRVRGGSDLTLDVMTTTHALGSATIETPVISGLFPTEQRTLSLAWTVYDPTTINSPFAAVDMASDGAALAQALGQLRMLGLSAVYADDHNHIGFHAVGAVPVRGAMVKHPVVRPQEDLEQGVPPNETEEEGASLVSQPMFTLAAYHPVRRRTRPEPAPMSEPKQKEEPIAPLPQPPDYTIGSAIPAVPVDALNADAQWSGYIPYDEMPSAADPMTGFVATANARVTPNGYPYAITLNWNAPYRAERITHVLTDTHGATPPDLLRLQMDVYSSLDSTLAQRMAYAIDHGNKPSARARQAADVLRIWNGSVDVDAAAPSIVAATRAELLSMLLVAQIEAHDHGASKDKPETIAQMYTWAEQGYAMEMLLQHQPARWLPRGYSNWNDLIAAAVDRALSKAHAPSKLAGWSYSRTHPVELDHPLLSATPMIDWLLGIHAGSGPRVIAGDGSCVKQTSRDFGPSERFTADLSNPEATTSNITTGESGNPASPWYLDQLPHWLEGTTLPLPLHAKTSAHTLTLTP